VAQLDTKDREKMNKRKFAYVDKEGEGTFLSMTTYTFVTRWLDSIRPTSSPATKKETARKKIVTAAKRRVSRWPRPTTWRSAGRRKPSASRICDHSAHDRAESRVHRGGLGAPTIMAGLRRYTEDITGSSP